MLLYVHSSFAIILAGKRKLVALLGLSSWYLVVIVWLFLAVPWVCLRFVIVVFPDHTQLSTIFLSCKVFHDWSIINLGNILFIRRVYISLLYFLKQRLIAFVD